MEGTEVEQEVGKYFPMYKMMINHMACEKIEEIYEEFRVKEKNLASMAEMSLGAPSSEREGYTMDMTLTNDPK